MAPTPSSKSNLSTPSSTKPNAAHHHSKTPQSKHRLNFTKEAAANAAVTPSEHPVEVIGRIRDHPELKNKLNANPSALQINGDGKSVRLKTEIGYRDFSLDGVSMSEQDDLEGFYKKFVESRINGVKLGQKCTIMMYGPTGSGKSHTMFGCLKQPGIVYNSLKGILGGEEDDEEKVGLGTFVQVTVLEIYNEEIYDLLSSANNGGGFSLGWSKGGSASKVKLEVMGKKAKNATFISGNEAGKILKEIQKVEKRRIVKSTLCNERSSRSHCMITVDVPTVGGRLMLVDMAGSENIEQAGQSGLEAKMQTAKINQGNIALKRVVESIANGDSHVPFRDSKLTMLLQDSFEDDKSKILMILCASPDPRELHKTIATLEYGAKAKCIVRGPHTPIKDKGAEDSSSAVILGSRIAALDQFIGKLQIENKTREKERNQAQKELSLLKTKLALAEQRGIEASEEEINSKVNERTQRLKSELERKIQECEKMANELVEMERRKMEDRILQQQQEVEMLRQRLEEIEYELRLSRAGSSSSGDMEGGSFMKKLMQVCSEDSDMVKSMDLDKSLDLETKVIYNGDINGAVSGYSFMNSLSEGMFSFPSKRCLTTVYEEEECENEDEDRNSSHCDDEVQKEVIEEKQMIVTPDVAIRTQDKSHFSNTAEHEGIRLYDDSENTEGAAASRQLRIQNIFTLCGNYRELTQHSNTPMPADSMSDPSKTNAEDSASRMINDISQLKKSISEDFVVSDKLDEGDVDLGKLRDSGELANDLEEDHNPLDESSNNIEVYVKWEASKENQGKFITTMKVLKDSTLADLRKLIEKHLGGDQQSFTFLALGDPSGAPVPKEKEATTQTSKLPICKNQLRGHLACLRPVKAVQWPGRQPFSPLENKVATTTPIPHLMKKVDECFSPDLAPHLSSTPFITLRRH
ncbi:P-loop containing nucleoside triphosphate hydrolases superfamily protein [Perilla frutescens var. frutescens]|nr:P-loop containing nucleoside triphosphate hydrolases superfamily protein [Perilla frutescens var. frutescens]